MRVRKLLVIGLFLLSTVGLWAQESTPIAKVWNKSDHHFSNQIWSVTCDDNDVAYFGNASGLIRFDSQSWSVTPIKGGSIIRSTLYDSGRIYAGSFEEFGYYETLPNGRLSYTSLSDLLENYNMNNEEIWNIFRWNEFIIFHSFVTIFIFDPVNNDVSFFDTKEFNESIGIDSRNTILSSAHGFSEIDLASRSVKTIPHPWKERMVAVLPREKESDLIVTKNEGIYNWDGATLRRWTTDCDDRLIGGEVNKAYLTETGDIIIGSSLFGCTAIDSDGHKLWNIDASDVLNGNTILNIGENKEGDVFLAMDSGIGLVDSNSGIRYIRGISENVGSVYCVQFRAPYVYIGSNQGLYVGVLSSDNLSLSDVRKIKHIQGPVLYLKEKDGQLFCGTNAETYLLSDRKAQRLSEGSSGGSCLAEGIINGKDVLIEGTYTKLCLYIKQDGKWLFSHRIEGFIQPISTIDIDFMGNIWAGHNSRGLYRITLDSNMRNAAEVIYYPSPEYDDEYRLVKVKKINGRTVFYDEKRIYTYDDMSGKIIPYVALNRRLGNIRNIMNINSYDGKKYWVLNPDDAFLVDFSDDDVPIDRISYSIFGSNSVDLLKEIKSGPEGWSIMTLDNSLAFIPDHFPETTNEWRPSLRLCEVGISENDGSQYENIDLDKPLIWNYASKLVKFTYSYPSYSEIGNKHIEYRLDGRDALWRSVEGEEIDLSHLSEGHYRLNVRVVNNSSDVLDEISTDFRIRPPLWRSTGAHILYILFALLSIGFICLSIKRRVDSQKKELENRRLESELNAKSREIASTTMSLLNKNKILLDLKEELSVQKNAIGSAYPDKYYRKMISAIDSQISSEQDWQLFQENFDRIHGNFFQILKSRYPSLTSSDLRFCSYLCMNLSSKEIASMMNISLKGVEAARYRIRKKIGLPSDVSLSAFLMELK